MQSAIWVTGLVAPDGNPSPTAEGCRLFSIALPCTWQPLLWASGSSSEEIAVLQGVSRMKENGFVRLCYQGADRR